MSKAIIDKNYRNKKPKRTVQYHYIAPVPIGTNAVHSLYCTQWTVRVYSSHIASLQNTCIIVCCSWTAAINHLYKSWSTIVTLPAAGGKSVRRDATDSLRAARNSQRLCVHQAAPRDLQHELRLISGNERRLLNRTHIRMPAIQSSTLELKYSNQKQVFRNWHTFANARRCSTNMSSRSCSPLCCTLRTPNPRTSNTAPAPTSSGSSSVFESSVFDYRERDTRGSGDDAFCADASAARARWAGGFRTAWASRRDASRAGRRRRCGAASFSPGNFRRRLVLKNLYLKRMRRPSKTIIKNWAPVSWTAERKKGCLNNMYYNNVSK